MAQLLPRFWREVVWNPAFGLGVAQVPPDASESYHLAHSQLVEEIHLAVRRLHAAGARLQVETDPPSPFVVPGASVYEEMRPLERIGFSAQETDRHHTERSTRRLQARHARSRRTCWCFREAPHRISALWTVSKLSWATGGSSPSRSYGRRSPRRTATSKRWLYDCTSLGLPESWHLSGGPWLGGIDFEGEILGETTPLVEAKQRPPELGHRSRILTANMRASGQRRGSRADRDPLFSVRLATLLMDCA